MAIEGLKNILWAPAVNKEQGDGSRRKMEKDKRKKKDKSDAQEDEIKPEPGKIDIKI